MATALRSLNDIDIACYISGADAPKDVQTLLDYLAERLRKAFSNFSPEQVQPRTYSVTVSFRGTGLDLDVVPNTFVSRMRGHFETDRSVLKRTVRWEDWLADAEADLALAQKLGGKVVLMGHSTGALLLAWLAIRNPDNVAGLILFSPAFGLHSFAQTGAWTSYLTRIDLVTADGKVRTGHSGLEVDRAARTFRAWLRANSRDGRPYTYASERLTNVPVWMANTAADIVIQKQEARAFMEALRDKRSSGISRKELWLPYSRFVHHDAIIMPSNPDLPLIKNSLREFLGQIH